MTKVITRGNTVQFGIVFYDAAGAVAEPDSATLQITYVGRDGYENTAPIALVEDNGAWEGSWNSAVAKGGWVSWHAHAVAGDIALTQDGRFKLSANRANLQHDRLPGASTGSDYAN